MRYPWHPQARGVRRLCALAGVLCIALGLVIFPDVTGTLPVARAGSSTTVSGPGMYDPNTGTDSTNPSSVTVAQTSDLVAQMVHVSWTGFTPSTGANGSPATSYDPGFTHYPVMVVQCPGAPAAVTDPSQCFGATIAGGTGGTDQNYGPYNTAYGWSDPTTGAGQLNFRLFTGLENQFLGCDQKHDCSLAIVPAQGGNPRTKPIVCTDHSLDRRAATGNYAFKPLDGSLSTAPCGWPKRIVVPLHFAPAPANCPFTKADISLVGSPVAARAVDQWRAGICVGTNPLAVAYNSAINEPEARADFLGGSQDMALTTRPATTTGKHPFTYAPVTVTGAAIAYWIDDASTGLPVPNLKLNQRLVAKLLTLSYGYGDGGSAVAGNPNTLFDDKEFQQLNSGVNPANAQAIFPMVGSGQSDLTHEVTRWIASSPDATGFLSGITDSFQNMKVNDYYKGTVYPTEAFLNQDPSNNPSFLFNPEFPLYKVSSDFSLSWPLSYDPTADSTGNHTRLSPQPPGQRALIAIVPLADAVAFHFPVAAILNGAGNYVTPTPDSVAAAVKGMSTNPDGITQYANMSNTDAAAYPLTMVQYAMAPTSGIVKAKAAKMAAFLNFVAGSGQTPGTAPGTLPDGILPLSAAQRAQTTKAAKDVQCQTGDTKTPGGTWCPSPTPTTSSSSTSTSTSTTSTTSTSTTSTSTSPYPSSSTAPAANVTGKLTPSPSSGVTLPNVAPVVSAGQRPADTAGFTRFLLPILLVAAGLLAVGGPALFVFGNTPWGAAMGREIRNAFTGRTP